MDTKVKKYRNSLFHRRCAFCKYYKISTRECGYQSFTLYECTCKYKHIKYPKLHRLFCRQFSLKED